jgi:D-alanyl-lipoteichoic acid acyltransferase DltB (MBOAT superfamily)
LTVNFWSPYTAVDLQVFWRRWHRTLSGWFRDYIYFPLGGGRGRFWAFNTLLVFVVSGIWHGAGFNFILWGAAHGLLLVLHRLFRTPIARLPKIITWLFTMLFVSLTWLFFYQTDWIILTAKLLAIVNVSNYSLDHVIAAAHTLRYPEVFGIFIWGGLSAVEIGFEFIGLRRSEDPYRMYKSFPVIVLMVVFIILTAPVVQNVFIYFNF